MIEILILVGVGLNIQKHHLDDFVDIHDYIYLPIFSGLASLVDFKNLWLLFFLLGVLHVVLTAHVDERAIMQLEFARLTLSTSDLFLFFLNVIDVTMGFHGLLLLRNCRFHGILLHK